MLKCTYPIFEMPRPLDFIIFHYLNVNSQGFKFFTNKSAGVNTRKHRIFREITRKITKSRTKFAQYNNFVATNIGVTANKEINFK